jgi:uncharacterized damage-inducible protein DinB
VEVVMGTEAWLEGPLDGIPPLLMPAAHALVQARRELHAAAHGLDADALWQRPGGAAAVGFHLRHIAGSIDRLLTYARGVQLDDAQMNALRAETTPLPQVSAEELLAGVDVAIGRTLDVLKRTPEAELLAARAVGRKRLPTNVLGLLFHIAEHTARHTGQTIATCKVVRADVAVGQKEPAP